MDIMQYIKPELLVLLPVMWLLGLILKKTPGVKDWLIPYILLIISILFCGLYVGGTEDFSAMSAFTAVTQAFLIAGASVGGNQLIKQAQKAGDEVDKHG